MSVRRAAIAAAVLALGVSSAVASAPATGVIDQKPGRAGCVSDRDTRGACARGRSFEKPTAIAISPDGASVYVASPIEGLAVFDRAAGGGALTQKAGRAGCHSDLEESCTKAPAGALYAVAASPDGRSVYTAGLDGLAIFDRDPLTGGLAAKAGRAGCVAGGLSGTSDCVRSKPVDFPDAIAVSPDSTSVYVGSSNVEAVTIFDRDSSGALRQKPGRAGCVSASGTGGRCVRARFRDMHSIVLSPDGRTLYVVTFDGLTAYDRDPDGGLRRKPGRAGCVTDSGTRGRCSNGKALRGVSSAAVSPDGESVYVAATDAVAVFDRDTATGALTQLRGRAGCISDSGTRGRCANAKALKDAESVTVSPDGRTVYVVGGDSVAVLDRDTATGALRQKRGRDGCVSESGTRGTCANGKALRDNEWVTTSPDASNVYVAASRSSAIAVFDRR